MAIENKIFNNDVIIKMMESGKLSTVEIVQLLQHAATRDDIAQVRQESENLRLEIKQDLKDSRNEFIAAMKNEMSALNSSLSAKIDSVDSKLSTKIDNVDSRLSAKIDNVNSSLSSRIDNVDKKLSNTIKILLTIGGGLAAASWYIATHIYNVEAILKTLSH